MTQDPRLEQADRQGFVDALDDDRITGLAVREALPASYLADLSIHVVPLLIALECLCRRNGRPLLIGINGCQGSGKSTLAQFVARLLHIGAGRDVATLSIDDFYLRRADRANLARDVHPLLMTRGVPGTHDISLAGSTLDCLLDPARSQPVRVPVFDKARDDRFPPHAWRIVGPVPDFVVLEGWCVGCPPQPDGELAAPVNALERDEDPDAIWRRYVNTQLEGSYTRLFSRIDKLVMLKAPSFDSVYAWRTRQERMLVRRVKAAASRPGEHAVMDAAALLRFISHYQRLTEFQLRALPAKADAVLSIDRNHRLEAHDGELFGRSP